MRLLKRHAGILAGVFITALSVMSGCAARAPQEAKPVFPAAPEEPRIAYLRSYKGALDFRKGSIFDAIFGVPSGSDFLKPYGVFAQDDKIYVADTQSRAVLILDTREQKMLVLGGGSTRLAVPIGVAVSPDGTVYVSDVGLKQVLGFDTKGDLKYTIGKPGEFKNPSGMAINRQLGRLYVVDSHTHKVSVYTFGGHLLFTFGQRGMGDGEFNYPTNAAIDYRNGNVYVVDTQNFRVQLFDKDGKFIRKFGQLGDIPGSFSRPKGIGVDSEGHVYVADAAFDNFQIFDEIGQILMHVGSAGNSPGTFSLPAGLYVDEKDRIYVVDSANFRVQVFQYLSEKWKKENPEQYNKYVLREQPAQ